MPRLRRFTNRYTVTQDVSDLDVVGAILYSCGPSLLSRSLIGQVSKQKKPSSAFTVAFACFKVKFFQLARRNRLLEAENHTLRQQNDLIRADIDLLQDELQNVRVRSYSLSEHERKYLVLSQQNQVTIKTLESRVKAYGEFIRILVDLKLDNPIRRAALAVMDDVDHEESLVDSIQKAAQNKDSAWSRIIPAVTGPRSPENYISALNLTLRTRKDLRERGKVSDFWKSRAMMNPDNFNIVTPSPSTLSDIRDEALKDTKSDLEPTVEPPVLDDMLDALKSGDTWPQDVEATHRASTHPTLSSVSQENSDRDSISESSSSILSKQLRNSLSLENIHAEEVASPLGILKNGDTATHDSPLADFSPPRIVRFASGSQNTIHPRPASIQSTSSSLSYISNVQSCSSDNDEDKQYISRDGTTESVIGKYSRAPEDISEEGSEFSGSDSILSDVYADFFNETEVESALPVVPATVYILKPGEDATHARILSTTGPSQESQENLLYDEMVLVSSGSEYSNISEVESFAREPCSSNLAAAAEGQGSEESDVDVTQDWAVFLDDTMQDNVRTHPLIPERPLDVITPQNRSDLTKQDRVQLADKAEKLVQICCAGRTPAANTKEESRTGTVDVSKAAQFIKQTMPTSASLALVTSSGTEHGAEISRIRTPTKLSNQATKRFGRMPPSSIPPKPSPRRTPTRLPTSLPRKVSADVSAKHVGLVIFRPTISNPPALPLPAIKPTSSTKSAPSSIPQNFLVKSPLKKSRFYSPKKSISQTLPTPHSESNIPGTPIRKLVAPRTPIFRRHALQMADLNTLSVPPRTDDASDDLAVEVQKNGVKPSAKDLGKRCGVIIIERKNIIPTLQPAAPDADILAEHSRMDINTRDSSTSQSSTYTDERQLSHPTNDIHREENVTSIREVERADALGLRPTTAFQPPKCAIITPLMLGELEQSLKNIRASADLSRFDALVASMSSSDLGSLEVTEDENSDSECEDPRRALKDHEDDPSRSSRALPHIRKALIDDARPSVFQSQDASDNYEESMSNQDFESTVATVAHPSPAGRPLASQSRTFAKSSEETVAVSSSSSSSSLCLESPTYSRIPSKGSLFGLAHRPRRATNTSPTPIKKTSSSILKPPCSVPTTVHSPPAKTTPVLPKPAIPLASRATTSALKLPSNPFSGRQQRPVADEHEEKAASEPVTKSNSKSSLLPIQSKSSIGTGQAPVTPESKPWSGQGILRRISNAGSRSKPAPSPLATLTKPAPPPVKSTSNSLAPPGPSQIKPRSNTINTLSPLPPKFNTPSSLTVSSPTKPRSNTVNAYSPHNRSPLSQHVTNSSLEFQSRLNHTNPSPPKMMQTSSSCQRPVQKPVPSSKIAQPSSLKPPPPLRITKKGATSKAHPSGSHRETGPAPPTAAFMRPGLSPPTTSTHRMTNSLAPLIPNWTTPDGIMSASQCRSMLRNSSMAIR